MSNGLSQTDEGRTKSQLAEFLEDYIRTNGITLAQLQQRLKKKGLESEDNYIYRVASGKIKKPHDKFLSALQQETGKSVAELAAMAHERPAAPQRYGFAFGHCFWARAIPLAFKGRQEIPDFEVASYCEGDELKFGAAGAKLAWH